MEEVEEDEGVTMEDEVLPVDSVIEIIKDFVQTSKYG